jgi:hypothetical protein
MPRGQEVDAPEDIPKIRAELMASIWADLDFGVVLIRMRRDRFKSLYRPVFAVLCRSARGRAVAP